MDYPSNSQNRKKPEQEPKKVEKIITGEVVRRKPSLGKRMKETFIGGDPGNVWMYVAYDILIPAVKDTIVDMITMGIERTVFGEGRAPSRRGRGISSYGYQTPGQTNYSSYSKPSNNRYTPREDRRELSRGARSSQNFDEILLETRAEAESIIDRLVDLIEKYDVASVKDLYDLVGVTPDFTDEKWGWADLRSASVSHTRYGYLLNLPRPEVIEL